ncbi:FliO/MopB family protein [Microbacterium sp. TWP3-1-2b2]|uniref:FliO/MopB family protein n=1 Tax=Microbacterium sp. TWP3-1-2b2 TaxID=2804651 RepID=UPI003CEE8BE1
MDDLLVVLRVALSLAAVLGLLWYLQRRFSRQSSRKRDAEAITVLGRQGLGAKAQLVMVQTADARYVLGVTEHGVSVVDRLPLSDAGADAAGAVLAQDTAAQHPPVVSAQDEPVVSNAEEFDRILLGESTVPSSRPQTHASSARLRVRHRSDPLKGSIISPETWRQTAEAIRRSR